MLLLCLTATALALSVAEIPNPLETSNVWVSDVAGIIDEPIEARMNARIEALHSEVGVEIAVVTAPSVDDEPKAFATALFNRWGLGGREANNGLLVLLVLDVRRLEMETGYGLEPVLPDGWLGAMQANAMVPKMKEGDYAGGLEAGLVEVDSRLRQNAVEAREGDRMVHPASPSEELTGEDVAILTTVGGAGILGSLLMIALAVGAIGATILGVRAYRRRQRTCPSCKILMPMLDEMADDEHLDSGQKKEEQLGSVDYQVHICPECGFIRMFAVTRWFSGYSRCPTCSVRAMATRSRTLEIATYSHGGRVEITEDCRNCSYNRSYTRYTPRLQRTSTRSSRGFGGFRGGGGGRGFGGGRSGGGGAGSSF